MRKYPDSLENMVLTVMENMGFEHWTRVKFEIHRVYGCWVNEQSLGRVLRKLASRGVLVRDGRGRFGVIKKTLEMWRHG